MRIYKSILNSYKFILCLFLAIIVNISFIPLYAQSNTDNQQPIVISRTDQKDAKIVNIEPKKDNKGKVLGTSTLTFTVTPDANGNWTYSIPDGLDPGTYNVVVKDANGKVLETSTVIVTSNNVTKVLPNTGILDSIFLPVFISIVLFLIGFFFYTKSFNLKFARK